jgi:uncharacterized protein YyaL (SSP411 family)
METYRDWPGEELLARFHPLPWSHASFRRAELFGQPVFLVLTVGWDRAAQQLEREVLTDPEVARTLNQGYVTIVVDADARPDIRERYQTGAWPAMAFLLPDGRPILSQADDLGRAAPITTSTLDKDALVFLLREGTVYWRKWTDLLMSVGAQWVEREGPEAPEAGTVDASASELAARWLLGNADREEGGFGAAPKFPVPALDEYAAMREARGLPALRRHSRFTLETLVRSPLFDRRGGGVRRLASAPSFGDVRDEKLLTGNAQLMRELIWSLRGAPSRELRDALQETAAFVTKTLGRDGGGFFLAQVAAPDPPEKGRQRPRRGRDEAPAVEKLVLSGPNATAGAALIRAGILLEDEKLVGAGEAALDLVLDRAWARARGVRHVIEPDGGQGVFLGPHAEVALGLLDAYETTGRSLYLDAARDIVDFASNNLGDEEAPTLRDHLAGPHPIGLLGNERRPLRGNVRLARAMIRLALHESGDAYRERALEVLAAYCGDLSQYRVHAVEPALAVEEVIFEPLLVRISGPPEAARTRALRRGAVNSPWPWTVILSGEGEGEPSAELIRSGESTEVRDPDALREAILAAVGGG